MVGRNSLVASWQPSVNFFIYQKDKRRLECPSFSAGVDSCGIVDNMWHQHIVETSSSTTIICCFVVIPLDTILMANLLIVMHMHGLLVERDGF
jgi:hypothetical protein